MKRVFVMICLAGIAFLSVQSGNVTLRGRLQGEGLKSPGEPVEVFLNPGCIEIFFWCNFGKMNIAVYGQGGNVIYDQGVDATSGSSLPINTNGWASGEYILLITDGQGGSLEGSFLID